MKLVSCLSGLDELKRSFPSFNFSLSSIRSPLKCELNSTCSLSDHAIHHASTCSLFFAIIKEDDRGKLKQETISY